MNPTNEAYTHRMIGDCDCGARHDPTPPRPQLRALPPPPKSRIVEEYVYRDEHDRPRFRVVRKDPKGFYQQGADGRGGWLANMQGVTLIPYRLRELLDADPSVPRFIPEGEKDVDRLRGYGFVATCNPMGAGKWRDEYAAWFDGRHVIILPDNDDAGRNHAAQVARSLSGVAASVRILNLPDLPPKGDVSDWFDRGGTADELRQRAADAPEWSPPADEGVKEQADQIGPDAAPDPNDFHQTETGDAEWFAAKHGIDLRYDRQRKDWLIWVGPHWQRNAAEHVHALSKTVAQARMAAARTIDDARAKAAAVKYAQACESRRKRENLVELARLEPPIADSGEGWDADPLLLAVPNGVIDLRTGELREGRREDRITMRSPVEYDPGATAPQWERFLAEVFAGDGDLITFIQRAIGYSLTGETGEHVLFICHGDGRNGKGTLLDTVAAMLGDYGHEAPAKMLEIRAGDTVPNDLAGLPGRRFVTARELPEHTTLNEQRIKLLTGEDAITARFLHKEFFTFRPVGKFWLMFNRKPEVRDDSGGFWSRLRMIPFGVQFGTGDAPPIDRALRQTLRGELPGILAWAVRGAIDWRRDGLTLPATVKAATDEYRQESDPIGQFIEACCTTAPGAKVNAGALYVTYENWEHGRDRIPMTQTAFGKRIADRFQKQRNTHGVIYAGIGLRHDG